MTRLTTVFVLALTAFVLLDQPPTAAQGAAATERRLLRVPVRVSGTAETELYDASHALVVGFSDYTAGWPDLPGVTQDIEAVKAVLTAHGFNVEVLRNPTRAAFDTGVRRFIAQHGQGAKNRLVVYVAGHGETQRTADGRDLGYIVPVDAPRPDRDSIGFKGLAISMAEIEDYATRIEAKHALFIFDSCFSGSLFEAMRGVPDTIAAKTLLPVRQFITAGTDEQSVPDRSIFREQFVTALQGEGDLNGDGYVTGTELGAFLEDRVTNYSRRAQTPRYGKIRDPRLDKGDVVFALTKPSSGPTYVPTPGPDPELLRREEVAFWEGIGQTRDQKLLKAMLEEYEARFGPRGRFSILARARLSEMAAPPAASAPPPVATTPPAVVPRLRVEDLVSAGIDPLTTDCDRGHAAACTELGRRYRDGRGTSQSHERARALLDRACTGGDMAGCVSLGFQYRQGQGVPQDFDRARALYDKACNGGEMLGCNNLGVLYRLALGMPQDLTRARTLYERACNGKEQLGCHNLGKLYENGTGVTQDHKRAISLYESACNAGSALGCTSWAYMFELGLGGTLDYVRARELYQKGCDGGENLGCANLGNIYANGRGTPQDDVKAIGLFQRTCEAGSAYGCRRWGDMYEAGRTVPANRTRALELFNRACKMNETEACASAKRLGGA